MKTPRFLPALAGLAATAALLAPVARGQSQVPLPGSGHPAVRSAPTDAFRRGRLDHDALRQHAADHSHVRVRREGSAAGYVRARRAAADPRLGLRPRRRVPDHVTGHLHGSRDRQRPRHADADHLGQRARQHGDDGRSRLQELGRSDASLGGSAPPHVRDPRRASRAGKHLRSELFGPDPRGGAPARRRGAARSSTAARTPGSRATASSTATPTTPSREPPATRPSTGIRTSRRPRRSGSTTTRSARRG